MSGFWRRLMGALVGMPDYDAYLAHHLAHHPERAAMTRKEFFRNRQEARYGKGGEGKCC